MELDGVMNALAVLCQVFLIDLLLSGDNAVVIALACRSLPPEQRREVILIGTLAGIALRVLLTFVATFLLAIPSLKLLGGFALIFIALKLLVNQDDSGSHGKAGKYGNAKNKLWSAVGMVVFADIVMSIDNVVGLAAAAQGNIIYLIFGLLLSVPLLMYGSLFVTGLLNRFSILVPLVGAMLGWLAGAIAISDPLIADWVTSQSPALAVVVPLLCAVYVLCQGKILNEARPMPDKSLDDPDWQNEPDLVVPAAIAPAPPIQQASVDIPAKSDLPRKAFSLTEFYRRNMVLIVLGTLITSAILFFSLYGKALLPTPAQLTRYDCPGYDGPFTIYYRHGVDHVQLRSGRHVVDGNLRNNKIEWDNNASAALGFVPPDEIVEGDKSLSINGGYFVNISCSVTP